MQIAAVGAQVAGTIMSAVGAHNDGQAQKAIATQQANQLEQNANAEQASAQQKMIQQNKQTEYTLSNAQASAAASGGGATDPTVNNVMKTIAGEGRFRALTDLYNGDVAAQGDRNQAAATRFSGDQAARAGNMKAFSTILQSAGSMYDKYSSPSPSSTTTPSQLPWQQPGYGNARAAAYYGNS